MIRILERQQHIRVMASFTWKFYLVALLIRAKKSLNERDNADMVFIVPAMPHKPGWRRLRLGAWCARVAMTYTLPASILGPVQRALFLRERRAFTTELLAPRTQKLDCASRARRLRAGPRAAPAHAGGGHESGFMPPRGLSGTRSPGATAKSESPPSMACSCVATFGACSCGVVRVTGPTTLCGCSRQDCGPSDEGWPSATRSRAGPLRRQCLPSSAAPPSHPCAGALRAPL